MSKNVYLIVLISALVIVILLFFTGSPVLTIGFIGIPLGNIILWIGILGLHLLLYIGNKGYSKSQSTSGKLIKALIRLLFVTAILWFGISYLLAGNLNFNFRSDAPTFTGSIEASNIYWNLIYTLIIGPIALSILYYIICFFEFKKHP
jgi:hypothetical protein